MPGRHVALRTKNGKAGKYPYRTFEDLDFGCSEPPTGRYSYPYSAGLWTGGSFHFRRRGIGNDNGDVLWDEPKLRDDNMAVGCRDKCDSNFAVSECAFAAPNAS